VDEVPKGAVSSMPPASSAVIAPREGVLRMAGKALEEARLETN
jgi:hypothetical protein